MDEKSYMGKLGLDLEVSILSEVLKFYPTMWMNNLTLVNWVWTSKFLFRPGLVFVPTCKVVDMVILIGEKEPFVR